MRIIVGSDEVGRGCFAGPLVAAAVVASAHSEKLGTLYGKDSKLLTAAQREELAKHILQEHQCAIGSASVEEIDLLGITLANQLAIYRAVANLNINADSILVDGNLKFPSAKYISIVSGDKLVSSISAASIIAKVHRDNLMQDLHRQFQMYQWHENKGYGTANHRKAIVEHGLSAHHRKSFCKKYID